MPVTTKKSSKLKQSVNSNIQKKSTGKRKFHTKSRKGCMTCKRRRVKCDETRDICNNCNRMGIKCVYPSFDDDLPKSHDNQNEPIEIHKEEEVSSVKMEKVITNPKSNPLVTDSITTPLPFPLPTGSLNLQGFSPISPGTMFSQLNQSPLTGLGDSPFSGMSGLVNAAASIQGSTPSLSLNIPTLSQPQTSSISPTPRSADSMPSIENPIPHGSNSSLPTGFNLQAAQQFLSGMPPDKQAKLIEQFSALPHDKQQQLQAMSMNMNGDMLGKLFSTSNDPLTGLIGDLLPNRVQVKMKGATPTPQELQQQYSKNPDKGPSISPDNIKSPMPTLNNQSSSGNLNLLDLRLMYHYTTKVWPTITAAGISDSKIWSDDIPMLAFQYPFLMHSVLAFSATHLSRSERGLDQYVTCHRADALRLLRDAVLEMSPENTDALVASALILIMDSLANASLPSSTSVKSLPPSAWIFHVKGAATILTAVWPLSEKSRFYKFISVDLGDLGEIGYDLISGELSNTSEEPPSRSNSLGNKSSSNLDYSSNTDYEDENNNNGNSASSKNSRNNDTTKSPRASIQINPDLTSLADLLAETYSKSDTIKYSSIQCFDNDISDMFPIPLNSPYFPTLAYMAKLYQERMKSDFILRIFAFPALLDKKFLGLLINCDLSAMRIMKCYYTLLRNFTEEMKEKVWFLEGVSTVLPVDVDQYSGGGGMHMMLDFLGGPSTIDDDGNGENYVAKSAAQSGLLDTNNLPSASMNDTLTLDGEDSQNDFMGVD